MLTQSDIDEYKAIYKKVYGKEISDTEARTQGTNLVNLFKVIARPIPENWEKVIADKYAKKNKNSENLFSLHRK